MHIRCGRCNCKHTGSVPKGYASGSESGVHSDFLSDSRWGLFWNLRRTSWGLHNGRASQLATFSAWTMTYGGGIDVVILPEASRGKVRKFCLRSWEGGSISYVRTYVCKVRIRDRLRRQFLETCKVWCHLPTLGLSLTGLRENMVRGDYVRINNWT